jgi:hypothetical protein
VDTLMWAEGAEVDVKVDFELFSYKNVAQ